MKTKLPTTARLARTTVTCRTMWNLQRATDHERGQTTAEYALVLLAAGSIAMMVVAWANGSGAVGELFDSILSRITSLAA